MGSRCNGNRIFVVNYNINNKSNDNNTNKMIKVMKDGTVAIIRIIIQIMVTVFVVVRKKV